MREDNKNRGKDIHFARSLATKWLGQRIIFFREVASTQDEARRLFPCTPSGLVIWADRQKAGRGRLSRKWFSPQGSGLYFSLILKEPLFRPLPLYGLITAIGVAEALEKEVGVSFQLKWPNDVLLNGRKIGGILLEAQKGGIIVGVGINVGLQRKEMPPEIKEKASSIFQETGLAISRAILLRTILNHLEEAYELLLEMGFESFRPRWQKRDVAFLARVILRRGDEVVKGLALGPASDGTLLLKTDSGLVHVHSGEILLWEIPGWENQAA